MMEKIYTALITPFDSTNSIDYKSFKKVLDKLYQEGERGFVVCGTTGETPTLTLEEKESLLDFVIEHYPDCSIIMGISTNDTKTAVKQVQYFANKAITALMVVVPYYNKPSSQGIYLHFEEVLKNTDKDIIIYNVPSRTGVEIDAKTIITLKELYPHLIGLKHASHNFEMVKQIKTIFPNFKIYCGEDALLKKGLDYGMDGIISVTSHMIYKKIKQLMDHYEVGGQVELEDDFIQNFAYYTFIEASPAPIKYMLYKKGYIHNVLRLPNCSLSKINTEKINQLLKNLYPIV